jgi:Coenzyme PQQ synthesis protein D (PqqD)
MNRESERLTPVARREGLVIQKLDDEVLVYDLERHRAHCLNLAAAAIWEQCDGQTSVPEIVKRLQAAVDPAIDEAIVLHGLGQLSRRRLLQQRIARGPDLSRREALRRFSVAAAIGLPVVASILAPTAAEAVSCVGAGGSCGGPGLPCCTGCGCIGGVCLGTCAP